MTTSTVFPQGRNLGSQPTTTSAASPTAGAWTTLSAPFRTCVDEGWEPRGSGQLAEGCERISDESQQAGLVTFGAESGGIVWLGRTESGDVAAIVVTSGLSDAKA